MMMDEFGSLAGPFGSLPVPSAGRLLAASDPRNATQPRLDFERERLIASDGGR